MSTFEGMFRDRSVALVGPSRSIVGSGEGAAIESFDLVARMNFQWPVPDHLVPDVGRRMDVLFHCCNQDFPASWFARADFADTRIAFYENGREAPVLTTICQELGVPAIDITNLYATLLQELGAFPSTGLVAIAQLLSLPIRTLKIFGMTFWREPYYDGYFGHGAAPENWDGDSSADTIWRHDPKREFQFFVARFCPDPRLMMDSRLANLL